MPYVCITKEGQHVVDIEATDKLENYRFVYLGRRYFVSLRLIEISEKYPSHAMVIGPTIRETSGSPATRVYDKETKRLLNIKNVNKSKKREDPEQRKTTTKLGNNFEAFLVFGNLVLAAAESTGDIH